MYQIFSFIIDARVLSCVANSLQECGLASIGSINDENMKVAVLLMSIKGIEVGHVDS